MLNFKEFLTEMFDDYYSIRLTTRGKRHYQYEFTTSDGRPGVIDFDTVYDFDRPDADEETEALNRFYSIHDPMWNLEFKVDGSLRTTGEGDAYRIMATVIMAIEDFYRKRAKDIGSIELVALRERDGRESRIKLYRRLLKKFALEYGFTFREQDVGIGVNFSIYKNIHNA